jgi:hypothetical protein
MILMIGILLSALLVISKTRNNIGYIAITIMIIGLYMMIYYNNNINIVLKEG